MGAPGKIVRQLSDEEAAGLRRNNGNYVARAQLFSEKLQRTDGNDSLQRFMLRGAPVRGEIVSLDASWLEIANRHELSAPVRDCLGGFPRQRCCWRRA